MLACVLFAACNASPILYSNSTLGVFFVVGYSSAKAFEDVVASARASSARASEFICTSSGIAPAAVVISFADAFEDVATSSPVLSRGWRDFFVACVILKCTIGFP